jgi:hypothetical protein
MEIIYRKPNKVTLEAIKEAKEGENLETLDMDNFEDFIASLYMAECRRKHHKTYPLGFSFGIVLI